MATRQHKNTSQYSPLPLPLEGTEQVEVWRDGVQYQTTLDVLGGNPGPHGESHESGGDRIGTQTPTADAIVRGDDNGQVNDWVADASTNVKGKVQLAANNESAANKAVQSNDTRMSNARPPTAHAASHLGGTDDLGLGTAAMLDVGVADGVCPLNSAGEVSESFIRNADNTQAAINGATAKATPVDADVFGFLDSAASYIIKKMTAANVKAWLKTYFDTLYTGAGGGGSVDNSSRVAEYTGDGIPLIPDNAAGRTYFQDAWATVDSWLGYSSSTLSVSGGILKATATNSFVGIYKPAGVMPSTPQIIRFRVKSSVEGRTLSLRNNAESVIYGTFTIGTTWSVIEVYKSTTDTSLSIRANSVSGDTLEIDWLYIGTGAYDTPALDRAGNGNNLTLNAVTPVNGKYGKEMLFNGSTSYAQASSPVIGTTGTVAVRFKANSFISDGRLFDNSTGFTGISYRQSSNTNIRLYVYDSTAPMLVSNITIIQTEYNSIVVCFSGLSFTVYVNGTKQGDYTSARQFVAGLNNLFIGRYAQSAVESFNGIISHFRYDSRIWSADEALAWSVNPSGEDSLSMSENPSAGDVMLWPDGGVSFLRSDNVGSGWATALGASKYSLGTRALSTTSTTSTAAIPAGEWYVSLIIDANTTGAIKVQTQADGWVKIFQGASASVQTVFYAGLIKSDGTNVIVERVSGSGTVYIDRINVG